MSRARLGPANVGRWGSAGARGEGRQRTPGLFFLGGCGGVTFAPLHVPLPLWFSFLFSAYVTRQVQHLGARGEHPGLEAHCSLRAEVSLGSWQGWRGRGSAGAPRGETEEPGRVARSGAREGTLCNLFAFLRCRERERELYGPKKRGPKPKTFLLKVTWPSPSNPLSGP